MEKEIVRELGENNFDTICRMFEKLGYKYEKNDEELSVTCTIEGNDLPMDIKFTVLSERRLIQMLSLMPFTVPEDKKTDVALALTVINNRIVDGSFDFDLDDGKIVFRLTSSYMESILGEGAFTYMLMVSINIIDQFNDKLLMLSKGEISFDQFKETAV